MTRIAGQPPLTAAEKTQIAVRYASGETVRDLRTEYHRTRQTIKDAILAAGVVIRPPGYGKGRNWTPEWREAHRVAAQKPEFREKSRKTLLKRLPDMRGPAVNTPIEQRMHDALKQAGIGFTTQVLLLDRYLVDMLLQQAPIVIEADGVQHTLREKRAADAVRDSALIAAGYRVVRFTGSAINTDAALCVQQVITECGLTPDREPIYEIRTRFSGPSHPNWKGGPAEFTCSNCGVKFNKTRQNRQGEKTFCTQKCYGEWLKAHPETNASKRVQRDWSELADFYGAGMSTKQLAGHYRCSQKAVLAAMRRLGIEVRPQGGPRVKGGFYQADPVM